MHTPQFSSLPQVQNLQKYPSMSSMASLGYLPPGHGYVPRKQKPSKPYGLSFTTTMNRTHRGPGRKYLIYAVITACVGLLFFMGAALYFGHRNVSRMMVYRTEVLGALMAVVGILCVGLIGHFLYKARVESNKWRIHIRFRPEGLNTASAVNYAYAPEMQECEGLQSGTYGKKALKQIPKPGKAVKGKKMKSKSGSKQSLNVTNEMLPPYSSVPPTDHSTPFGTLEHPTSASYPRPQAGEMQAMDRPAQVYYPRPQQPGQPMYPAPAMPAYHGQPMQPGYQGPIQPGYPMTDIRGPPPVRHVKLVGVPETAESDL